MKRWLSGKVQRYHTWNLIKHQSVGEHTFGVYHIVKAVHPEPSYDMIDAIMQHDSPELRTGDLPFPTKRYRDIGSQITEIENKFIAPIPLSNLEFKILKWADMAELVIYLLYETEMGNKTVIAMGKRGLAHLLKMEQDMPPIYQDRMERWRKSISFDTTFLLEPEPWTI